MSDRYYEMALKFFSDRQYLRDISSPAEFAEDEEQRKDRAELADTKAKLSEKLGIIGDLGYQLKIADMNLATAMEALEWVSEHAMGLNKKIADKALRTIRGKKTSGEAKEPEPKPKCTCNHPDIASSHEEGIGCLLGKACPPGYSCPCEWDGRS